MSTTRFFCPRFPSPFFLSSFHPSTSPFILNLPLVSTHSPPRPHVCLFPVERLCLCHRALAGLCAAPLHTASSIIKANETLTFSAMFEKDFPASLRRIPSVVPPSCHTWRPADLVFTGSSSVFNKTSFVFRLVVTGSWVCRD